MNGPSPDRPKLPPGRRQDQSQDVPGIEPAGGRIPTILVVDDDPQIRELLDSALHRGGFDVVTAASQAEAVDVFRAHHPDIALALIDLFLPDGDGLGTITALRSLEPTLCCCVMTGGGGEYSIDGLFAHGAAIVFHKPFDLRHLLRAVQHLVFGPRLQAEPASPAPPIGSERRRFPRWKGSPREVVLSLSRPTDASESRGSVVDRSLHGVGIVTPIAAAVGDALRVRSSATAYEKWLNYEVRHIHPRGEHQFLGCRLTEPPTLNVLSIYE